ncbi:MAG: diacylglycerol kinase [Actinobacteria bacterium]|nr:diacylglycerol kinase [Actinomycetota bacterium]
MKSGSLLWSFNYAIAGIVYALRTQRNMRLHFLAAAVILFAALALGVSRLELIGLVLVIALVMATELINTAIEAAIDISIQGFDPLAKIAKDVAAGAVFISSLAAVAIGYLVFFNRIALAMDANFHIVKQAPVHLTVIALSLTSLAVLAVKAIRKEDNYLRGGWPSGHTALAASAASAITYLTLSGSIGLMAFFVAALVAQSRVEAGAHTIAQVVFGAFIGLLMTTLVFQVFWL